MKQGLPERRVFRMVGKGPLQAGAYHSRFSQVALSYQLSTLLQQNLSKEKPEYISRQSSAPFN